QEVGIRIKPVPFHALINWSFHPEPGNLCHASGKFFSIEGVQVVIDDGCRRAWTQPIINQPEIGILGILAREINGVMCFLLQAKIEPGNVNHVQLSPTLQATRSNYSMVHKGTRPRYLEYFQHATPSQIILDQLQSEQGARFLRKRNRNIILKITEDIPLTEDFRWLTLGQIKALMNVDNVVNMDTRTVISGLPFHGFLQQLSGVRLAEYLGTHSVSSVGVDLLLSERTLTGHATIDGVLFWLAELKSRYELQVQSIPLRAVKDWLVTETEIVRPDRQYFRVLGVEVMIDNREVKSWHQPLIEPMQEGLCAFIIKKIHGVYHFLVQAKIECGNFDVVEMAPTVQCLTGRYHGHGGVPPPYVDYVLGNSHKRVFFDTKQSEEGGRFYHEQNRNLVVEADDAFPNEVPENFNWLTLGQIKEFLRFNNYLNIQARSLLAALDYR
ncbi:MAG: NDP-hexose 2,3-dehydratase family protein, partial [bacterium]